jgi:hypothetical protein
MGIFPAEVRRMSDNFMSESHLSESAGAQSAWVGMGWGDLEFLGEMAVLALVFVVVSGLGSILNDATASLSLPKSVTVGVQVIGYGLQIFAACWFIVVATRAWHVFVRVDYKPQAA